MPAESLLALSVATDSVESRVAFGSASCAVLSITLSRILCLTAAPCGYVAINHPESDLRRDECV